MTQSGKVWHPKSPLDHALLAWLRAALPPRDREIRQQYAWRVSQHARQRFTERCSGGLKPSQGGRHIMETLDNPSLRKATGHDLDRIRASCVAHSGEFSREPYGYFTLGAPDGQSEIVFAAMQVMPGQLGYNWYAAETWHVFTTLVLPRTDGAARRRRTHDRLFRISRLKGGRP